jgi:anti-anti-sigma regulatory factor
MNTPAAEISVWAGTQFACIKIRGRANFTASLDFNLLVTQLQERGFTFFVIELSECSLIDSTFLGVLAGLGLKTAGGNEKPAHYRVELRNASPRITELMEDVGVLHLFETAEGELAVPEKLEAGVAPPVAATRQDLTRACLEAHELLMAINPENVTRFKDVTKFLAEDLARGQNHPA